MRRTLKTKAGSTVILDGERVSISFDWFEEDHACIDCEVDADLTRATGWRQLMWRCEADDDHNCAFAPLHRFNPNQDTQPV